MLCGPNRPPSRRNFCMGRPSAELALETARSAAAAPDCGCRSGPTRSSTMIGWYYISRSLLDGSAKAKAEVQRIPAAALESLVVRRIRDWLTDPASILQAIQYAASDAVTQKPLIERASDFAKQEHDRAICGPRPAH